MPDELIVNPIDTLNSYLRTVLKIWPVTEVIEDDTANVHFFQIQKIEPGRWLDEEKFIRILKAALNAQSYFQTITPDEFCQGMSYIPLGAWLGYQTLALLLIGIGHFYDDLWMPITPATMGIDGPIADDLAGRGMVMIAPSDRLKKELLDD